MLLYTQNYIQMLLYTQLDHLGFIRVRIIVLT